MAAPTLATTATVLYYFGRPNGFFDVVVDPGITVTDGTNLLIATATATISANFTTAEDTLAATDGVYGSSEFTSVWDSGTGILTMTATHGHGTAADWQTYLRTVTYTNSADNPNTKNRTISFAATDTTPETSTAATRDINVYTQIVTRAAVVAAGTGGSNPGLGTIAWTNPGNVEGAQDGTNATAALLVGQQTVLLTGLFPSSLLDTTDEVVGIRISVVAKETAGVGVIKDTVAKLLDDTADTFGTNQASSANTLGATYSVIQYGGYNSLWGSTGAAIAALIRTGDLGFAFSVSATVAVGTAGVDSFLIEVFVKPLIVLNESTTPVGYDYDGGGVLLRIASGKVTVPTGTFIAGAGVDWATPHNIEAGDDGINASASLTNGQTTDRLMGGFRYTGTTGTTKLLSDGQVVVGIGISVKIAHTGTGFLNIVEATLYDRNGAAAIGNNLSVGEFLTTNYQNITFGGTTNMWGVSAGTLKTLLDAGNLGFAMKVESDADNGVGVALVDSFTIVVTGNGATRSVVVPTMMTYFNSLKSLIFDEEG